MDQSPRFDRKTERLHIGAATRSWNGDGTLILHRRDLQASTVRQLMRALDQASIYWGGPDSQVLIAATDQDDFDEDYVLVEPISLIVDGGELQIQLDVYDEAYEDGKSRPDFEKQLRVLLARHRLQLLSADVHPDYMSGPPWLWLLTLRFDQKRRSVGGLLAAADEMHALLTATSADGKLTRPALRELIVAGSATLLVGLRENQWLEVKRQHFDLTKLHGKVKLAQAVARFANSSHGGLLVIGATTKSDLEGDTITKLSPMPATPGATRRYKQALQSHLYPAPAGMSVQPVEYDDGELLVIDVPPQPEELKPFLVHGAVVDGVGEGSFISIVRREDDSSIPITASMIHSTLAAGRALFQRGLLPVPPNEGVDQAP